MPKLKILALSIFFLLFIAVVSFNFATPVSAVEVCTVKPPTNLQATSGPSSNQITLNWTKSESTDVEHYTLVYGLQSKNYIYGAVKLDGSQATSFTVSQLQPGTKYYFQVWAVKDCAAASNEASAIASGRNNMAQNIDKQITTDTYTVQRGDWLSTIAHRVYGNSGEYRKIAQANNIQNPNLIYPGMVLKIPK